MKVLVTGSSGFIGAELLKYLQNMTIVTLGRGQETGYQHYRVDLNDAGAVYEAVTLIQPDVLIHLAWEGIPDFSPALCERNYQQHVSLFNAITKTNCKQILVSGTCMEYRGLSGGVCESQQGPDLDEFGNTKVRIFNKAQSMFKDRIFYWVRPFYVYGPGQRVGSLIPSLMSSIARGTVPELRNPDAAQDFVHISDIAEGIVRLIQSAASSGCYNLGSGHLTAVSSIVEWLGQAWQGRPLTAPDVPPKSGMYADNAKIKQALAWEPTTSMPEAIRKWVADVKGH